jgi:hypothetical protein
MSIDAYERCAALADEAVVETTLGPRERGFSVEVVDDLDASSHSLKKMR